MEFVREQDESIGCINFRGENNEIVGGVNRSPDSVEVVHPGKWSAWVMTTDDGLITLGVFDSPEDAECAVRIALGLGWDWTAWQNWLDLHESKELITVNVVSASVIATA